MQPAFYYNPQFAQQMTYGIMQQQVVPTYFQMPDIKIQTLKVDVPIYDYVTSKTVMVPFDKEASNNGMFTSPDDAMKFIGKHAKRYHGQFNRQLAKSYAQYCHVLDFVTGTYFPLLDIPKREFNNSFQRISKSLA